MNIIKVTIDEDTAEVKYLISAESPLLILPDSTVRRASHIVPANLLIRTIWHALRIFGDGTVLARFTRSWRCKWLIDFSPIGQGILGVQWDSRESAIAFEVDYLERTFL
jgi:hypothetical protein